MTSRGLLQDVKKDNQLVEKTDDAKVLAIKSKDDYDVVKMKEADAKLKQVDEEQKKSLDYVLDPKKGSKYA